MSAQDNLSPEQFFHGTKSELKPGDTIDPGHTIGSSRGLPYAYASADIDEARHFAVQAGSAKPPFKDSRSGQWLQPTGAGEPKHVYEVQPTGRMMRDPNEPSGPNFRSRKPLKVLRHVETFE